MPKEVKINWKCEYDFCGRGFSDFEDCVEHEKECRHNPTTKHCTTCKNDIPCKYTPNSSCAFACEPKYFDIWDSNLGNCDKWELKSLRKI